MALPRQRIPFLGKTEHAHEKEGIDFALNALPNTDPYHAWGLFELVQREQGRLYEVDLLVLARTGLFLVELKGRPGVYTGDHQDWDVYSPDRDRPAYMENPFRLTNHKAKVLSSMLRHRLRRAPWVQPLVFLSAENVELKLQHFGDLGVVTRKSFARAITHHEFPGARKDEVRHPVNTPMMRDVVQAIRDLGIKESKGQLYVGSYELTALLDDGDNYQEWGARHRSAKNVHARARVYLEPEQADVEQRRSLRRAAEREVDLLQDVREHPHILPFKDYVEDGRLGPTLLYDAFDRGELLDAFLRKHPDLSLDARIGIIRDVGYALTHCHNKQVLHGNVHPRAVLARTGEDGNPEVRLFRFQLGRREQVTGTQHRSILQGDVGKLYQAPELFHDPSATSPAADLFSLGALAYFVLTGVDPASSPIELQKRLLEHQGLQPQVASEEIPKDVGVAVEAATQYTAAYRPDSVGEWLGDLLEAATSPDAPPTEEVSPYEATKESILGQGRFLVERVLGRGATSHVLQVLDTKNADRSFALKVSLGERHDERLQAEAEALGKLNDRRIVQLVEKLTLGDRTALLLSLAGSKTLQAQLADEGPVSLDFACRYGEDLLDSLWHLEEQSVPHRDIKPANLGVGSAPGRRGNHLVLFDFSLVGASPEDIDVGTAVYRDPFLIERGRWDSAGDRWSAAVTLHEMLTGERPQFRGAPLEPSSELVLSAQRFEIAREELVAFFEKALARKAEDRFPSAEAMRRAWSTCFVERAPRAATAEVGAQEPESSERPLPPAPIDYAAIGAETPIAQLPLSARARNGLERAGLVKAEDLLSLPANHLSAVRGVSRGVAKEVLSFRDRWQQVHSVQAREADPFYPGYSGANLPVARCEGIAPELARVLADGGLKSLLQVAAAPRPRVEALCFAAEVKPKTLAEVLKREVRQAREAQLPTSLESWMHLLVGGKSKALGYVRALYGLDAPFEGQLDVTGVQVGGHFGVNPVNVYVAVAKQRARWGELQAQPALLELCGAVLEEAGGILPLAEAARRLLAALPHAASTPDPLLTAQAATLLRVASELEGAEEAPALERLQRKVLWVSRDEALTAAVRRLGSAADELASRDVLASPAEVVRVLTAACESPGGEAPAGAGLPAAPGADAEEARPLASPLAQLPAERLVPLAAEASQSAAASAHLELYPRDMPAQRALQHSAAILTGELSPEEVQRRVSGRYPEASPLPPRPALDKLLEGVDLTWNGAAFMRHARGGTSTFLTHGTRLSEHRAPLSDQDLAAAEFRSQLRSTLEHREVRLLSVRSRYARAAAQRLAGEFGLAIVSLDHELVAEMKGIAAREGIELGAIYATDRQGPASPQWGLLKQLATQAAKQLATRLLPPEGPVLFTQMGLLARYALGRLLENITTSVHAETAPVLILVAGNASTGFAINGALTIPGVLPAQCTPVSPDWLRAERAPHAAGTAPLKRTGSE